MTSVPRVLITNDDGVRSAGLHCLAEAAAAAGADVVVAAPATEASGSSAAITAVERHGHIVHERHRVDSLGDMPVYAVPAAPALISLIAMNGAFGPPPELVLSGVNYGANVGRAILHSGTVGAALTAGLNGARGLAVSLDVGLDPTETPHWETAADIAAGIMPFLHVQPVGTVLNLNVPDAKAEHVAELHVAPLAPFGAVQTVLTEEGEGMIRLGITDVSDPPPPGTDAAVLANGYAVITAVQSVCETPVPALDEVISGWVARTPDGERTPSGQR
ncbi:5'/3'-nucleotidase SurE [Phytoactinopolyspora alkaliphila]|uniref:5'-nucleotidase n=1 Tax=Phytoactinopolyspora alkaliphila TaxID=1783498 RepID=A0A6N9YJ41_9ACTN|nr:5'/3'-nucleotidase SurE [Phytoactinopolyspora alkaliphila]NED94940.1 5'/3'-nucleotidase SurE [Phytoactinopolyspora alkaliphila]